GIKDRQGAWFMVMDGDPNQRGEKAVQILQQDGFTICQKWDYRPEARTSLTEWQRINGPFYTFGDQIQLQQAPANRTPSSFQPGEEFDLARGFHTLQKPAIDY